MKKENQGVKRDEKGGKRMNEEKQGFVAARSEEEVLLDCSMRK